MNETVKINGTTVRITVTEDSINIHAMDDKDEMAGMIKVNLVHSRLVQINLDKPTKRNVL